jgi:hypothetical protein
LNGKKHHSDDGVLTARAQLHWHFQKLLLFADLVI